MMKEIELCIVGQAGNKNVIMIHKRLTFPDKWAQYRELSNSQELTTECRQRMDLKVTRRLILIRKMIQLSVLNNLNILKLI